MASIHWAKSAFGLIFWGDSNSDLAVDHAERKISEEGSIARKSGQRSDRRGGVLLNKRPGLGFGIWRIAVKQIVFKLKGQSEIKRKHTKPLYRNIITAAGIRPHHRRRTKQVPRLMLVHKVDIPQFRILNS